MKAGVAVNIAVAQALHASGLRFERRLVSAIEAFWPIHSALRVLESRRNAHPDPLFAGNPLPYGISVGTITAGDWASSVPDSLVAHGRYGIALDEDPAAARREFEDAIASACATDPWLRDHPAIVTWPGGQFASGRLDGTHPLIAEVADATYAVTGARPLPAAAPYGSDLRLYLGHGGIPTLQYGPGDVRLAHGSRESIPIQETIDVARSLVASAATRLGEHR